MRKLLWMFASVLGCSMEDDPPAWPVAVTTGSASLDAGAGKAALDASSTAHSSGDAASACPPVDVCMDQKPYALYNVCFTGAPGEATSATKACLIDPNGALYLAALAPGRVVINAGWSQSPSSAGATLSAENEQRCAQARAALVLDASTPSPCAEP